MKTRLLISFLFTLVMHYSNGQSPEKLLPTMGWEPWSISHCKTSEGRMYDAGYYMALMDLMEAEGFSEVGYRYLIIECNDHFRDEEGMWTANTEKFPGERPCPSIYKRYINSY